MGVIKWSDLFASLLGEKDTVTIDDTIPPTPEKPETDESSRLLPTTTAPAPDMPSPTGGNTVNQQNSPGGNTEFNTAERDALLAEIARLKQANQQLVMQGTLSPNNDISSKSDTELIFNLCAGRSKDGRTFSNNESTAAGAGV